MEPKKFWCIWLAGGWGIVSIIALGILIGVAVWGTRKFIKQNSFDASKSNCPITYIKNQILQNKCCQKISKKLI